MAQYPVMAYRTCPNCNSQVSSEDEFCPHCGGWTSPLTEDSGAQFTLSDEADMPPANQPGGRQVHMVHCPLCDSANPTTNRHCEECGARLGTSQLPVAPQPMIHSTAAMRTAIIAGGVLIGILLIALMVRTFGGGSTEDTTPVVVETTVPTAVDPVQTVQAQYTPECEAEYGNHPCAALHDGGANDWNAPMGENTQLTIVLKFDRPYDIRGIGFTNLQGDRFLANHRVNAINLSTNDATTPQVEALPDQPGSLPVITYNTRGSTTLTIVIRSWFDSQAIGSGEDTTVGFNDISIEEIQVFGTSSS
jgi:hypothetical protein